MRESTPYRQVLWAACSDTLHADLNAARNMGVSGTGATARRGVLAIASRAPVKLMHSGRESGQANESQEIPLLNSNWAGGRESQSTWKTETPFCPPCGRGQPGNPELENPGASQAPRNPLRSIPREPLEAESPHFT